MDTALKLCLIALISCALIQLIRNKNPQGAFFLSIAVCIVIMTQIIPFINDIYDFCRQIISSTGIDASTLRPLVKVLGIAVCVRITAELCRDCGERAVAAKVEMAGAAVGMVCAFPLLQQVLEIIGSL